jgi:hypothetical protein
MALERFLLDGNDLLDGGRGLDLLRLLNDGLLATFTFLGSNGNGLGELSLLSGVELDKLGNGNFFRCDGDVLSS